MHVPVYTRSAGLPCRALQANSLASSMASSCAVKTVVQVGNERGGYRWRFTDIFDFCDANVQLVGPSTAVRTATTVYFFVFGYRGC